MTSPRLSMKSLFGSAAIRREIELMEDANKADAPRLAELAREVAGSVMDSGSFDRSSKAHAALTAEIASRGRRLAILREQLPQSEQREHLADLRQRCATQVTASARLAGKLRKDWDRLSRELAALAQAVEDDHRAVRLLSMEAAELGEPRLIPAEHQVRTTGRPGRTGITNREFGLRLPTLDDSGEHFPPPRQR